MKHTFSILLALAAIAVLLVFDLLFPQRIRVSVPAAAQTEYPSQYLRRDAPPDTTPYQRAAIPEDRGPMGKKQPIIDVLTPDFFILDTIVSNTNAGLAGSDTFGDSEPSIAAVCTSVTCPANITTTVAAGQCVANVTYPAPTTTGTCTVTCAPASGSSFPKGTTTVTCSNTGGTPNCTFTITVIDNQAPTIIAPANIIRSTDPNLCSAVVTYPAPIVSDNCPGVGIPVCAPASGSTFPPGVTVVVCTVGDVSGNTATSTFTTTVNDTQPPSITCPAGITKFTDVGQLSATVIPGTPVALDNCSVSITGARSDGKALNAPYPVGVTMISWKVTDAGGNTATCGQSIAVMVPSGQRRKP